MRETFVFHDGQVVPKREAPYRASLTVMPDLEPFVSVVDGSVIGSRTDRRAHNKRHGVIDVGDDRTVFKPRPEYRPEGLIDDIKRAME